MKFSGILRKNMIKGGLDRIAVKMDEFYKTSILSKTSSLSLSFDPTYAPTEHIITVAEIVGVPETTVTMWRNQNYDFVSELEQRRLDHWNKQVDRLRSLIPNAIDVLMSGLDSGNKQFLWGGNVVQVKHMVLEVY